MAAIQAAPVPFDREASTEKACQLIGEAAEKGATIAAFGECWLPGYPLFAFLPPTPLRFQAGGAYIESALQMPGQETTRLCKPAKKANVDVAIGIAELDVGLTRFQLFVGPLDIFSAARKIVGNKNGYKGDGYDKNGNNVCDRALPWSYQFGQHPDGQC